MTKQNDNNNQHNPQDLNLSDLFAEDFEQSVPPEQFFADSEGLDFSQGSKSGSKDAQGFKKHVLTAIVALALLINISLFAAGGIWLYFNLPSLLAKIQTTDTNIAQSQTVQPASQPEKQPEQTPAETDYEGPVSFPAAEAFFNDQNYKQAYLLYNKLQRNLTTNIPSDRYLSDYLDLKMALSLDRQGFDTEAQKHFSTASDSISPFVRALTSYHLAFIQIKTGKFLQARQNAYKALALTKCFERFIDENFQSDCYFIACESLTREVLALCNKPTDLPGKGWSDSINFQTLTPTDQQHLRAILEAGIDKIGKNSIFPHVTTSDLPHLGTRYSATAVNASISELLEKTASASSNNIQWVDSASPSTQTPITVYCENTTAELITEISAGTAGLIARFDNDQVLIYDPQTYQSLDQQKQLLSKEAITLWRRFMMRFRGDHRIPNASFSTALMLECSGFIDSAINHYTRTASNFVHSSLAPYALLNSAELRTELMDYSGAKQDLTQLVMQYSESGIANQAYLNLAKTSMNSGHYSQAVESFIRLYNTDISETVRAKSALGAGMCYFHMKDFSQADNWLTKCIQFENKVDMDFPSVYFNLGKAKMNRGDFQQASVAFKNSITDKLPTEEVVNILIHLAIVQTKQGNFVSAMDTIEAIETQNLSQELIVETLITKSYILRASQLPENAVPILRHYLAYLADAKLRSKLGFELAKCYYDCDDYVGARNELINALADPENLEQANDINYTLADVHTKLGNYSDAIDICTSLVNSESRPLQRKQIFKMLGDCYSKMQNYEMAALAYSGKITEGGSPSL